MENVVTYALLLIVVFCVVGILVNTLFTSAGHSTPVHIVVDSVYQWGRFYTVNAHVEKISGSQPVGLCQVTVTYSNPSGRVYSVTIPLAVTPTVYRHRAVLGCVEVEVSDPYLSSHVITITIGLPAGSLLHAVRVGYCEYGVSTTPRWAETLLSPEPVKT